MPKVAILIDGGYFLKRIPTVLPNIDMRNPQVVVGVIEQLVHSHLEQVNEVYRCPDMFQLLYRIFYYDAKPYEIKAELPISKRAVNYATSSQAIFRTRLFKCLHHHPNLAVRLGKISRDTNFWTLKAGKQKLLQRRTLDTDKLTDNDFSPPFARRESTCELAWTSHPSR